MSTIAMSGLRAHLQQQVVGRSALADDVEPLAAQQARDPLAQEHGVVGKDDADRRRHVVRLIEVVTVDLASLAQIE